MSAVSRKGVVDPDLESWEIPSLYVVDGGVVRRLGRQSPNAIMSHPRSATIAGRRAKLSARPFGLSLLQKRHNAFLSIGRTQHVHELCLEYGKRPRSIGSLGGCMCQAFANRSGWFASQCCGQRLRGFIELVRRYSSIDEAIWTTSPP